MPMAGSWATGQLADFAGLKLEPNGEKEARRYLEAEPGDDLNLDTKEIAAFRALKSASKDGAVPIEKVEALIREELLARYQAYHTKGLAGIAPYARKSRRHVFARDELSLATKQSKLLAKYLPSVSNVLLNYPATKIKEGEEFEEQFFWMNVEVFGRPTYVLSHRMHFRIGEASIVVDRHFYASHAYNSLQQGVMALPTTGRHGCDLPQPCVDRSSHRIWILGEASRGSCPDGVLPEGHA